MTEREGAIISAYTGKMVCKNFSTFHGYVEEILKRPVWTHEMGNSEVANQIKEASKDDFMALMEAQTS